LTQDQEVFFFKEGYLRTSSSEYTTDKLKLDDDYIHLTNNAVQKNAPGYGTYEDGNQVSFQHFRDYLIANYKDEGDVFTDQILPKMKYYAALSMMSAKKKMNSNRRKQCFELFGYDYIIDKDFNVFLIEANTNPCIEESSTLLKALIPRMINDALKLTIDQIFPPPENAVDGNFGIGNSMDHNPQEHKGYDSKEELGSMGMQLSPIGEKSLFKSQPPESHKNASSPHKWVGAYKKGKLDSKKMKRKES